MNKTPDFIIIGAMKCATSTLHEQLALQPGIFMSQLKEPNFFSNDEEYEKGWNWYLSHFESAPVDAFCGESSTHYTKLPTYPETIQRIQHHLPKAKFIYVMRHPIDRLVSQYIHEWTQKVITEEINLALKNHPELIDYSCYMMQLQPYFETFGQDRVLPIFFERMLSYPQAELERVCEFIGYPQKPIWNFELEAQNVSTERMRKSAWRDFLVETPGLRELRRLLVPKSFRTWVRSWWAMKQKPELTPENHENLRLIFNSDLAVLGSKLGIELSCDNFKSVVKNQAFNWV
ncbi:sulfotransferase [Planktothrix sp. FACHB-1365]|uniref:sulfotransferase family protein n=1 Tax=Planktothrix sp. FACHB-1365 TaxID=2692855 RepID=UPI001686F3FC|nr:sulfotransferase [Planktothrix sp. FACHB-1365]MBD2485205.1 sulfotransferase [Planktothrix sp. FACHB-1365]